MLLHNYTNENPFLQSYISFWFDECLHLHNRKLYKRGTQTSYDHMLNDTTSGVHSLVNKGIVHAPVIYIITVRIEIMSGITFTKENPRVLQS